MWLFLLFGCDPERKMKTIIEKWCGLNLPPKNTDERLKSQIELDRLIQYHLALHTPLLYIKNKKKRNMVEGVASSIYVAYRGNHYIITAGHTFSKYSYKNISLHAVDVSLELDSFGIIFLPKEESFSTVCDYYEMDYGIFKLKPNGIKKIEKFYRPFPISTDVKKYKFVGIEYFVFGYAASQNKQKSTRKPFVAKYHTLKLPRHFKNISTNNYNPDANMALNFAIDNCIRTTNFASKSFGRAPTPNGLSGCGIWSIPNYPNFAGGYSLQGMLTHYDNKRFLIGFVIQDMVSMIELFDNKIENVINTNGSNISISIPGQNN